MIAIDLQQKMLDIMLRRARRARVEDRITFHHCEADSLGINLTADFILAFWMVHEVSDKRRFFQQLKSILSSSGKILIAEPKMHVAAEEFDKTVEIAVDNGFRHCGSPSIGLSLAALLEVVP